ncbi:MAG: DUF2007 domain-containing protein [Flavobacteriaceae bacterium]|nr:DUF2007 domain-containing protein [Bacteroidia bacterium]NND10832.1 DUF2007 domain-containing protein [Flavobacteriaceae bacterium]NNK26790.1 DUF2007 domain-containing protein [Flavobacteriaceae bacterium]NNL60877.1 DUF2007 domain-containing protein [Flavobacteriaceae bacterium]
MHESEYIKIFTGSFVIAKLIVSRLEEIGISPVIKDEAESGRLAGFGPSIPGIQELYVHEDELDKAAPIVEEVRSSMSA